MSLVLLHKRKKNFTNVTTLKNIFSLCPISFKLTKTEQMFQKNSKNKFCFSKNVFMTQRILFKIDLTNV